MKVYIVRHGKAEPHAPSGRDEDRVLALRGKEQAWYLGEHVRKHGPLPSRVVSSPAARARETASIVQRAVGCSLELADPLRVDEPTSGAIELLALHAETAAPGACLMYVGHNPQVSELCEILVRGIGAARCTFRTGEAALLEVRPSNLVGTARFVAQLRLEEESGAT